MARFGKTSTMRLDTCNHVLIVLFGRVVVRRDCFVACGHRPKEDQEQAFLAGTSRVRWPDSAHNSFPSDAADVCPWPEQWASKDAFLELSEVVREEWAKMEAEGITEGYELIWGGDWDSDGDRSDQTFDDMPHWELRKA